MCTCVPALSPGQTMPVAVLLLQHAGDVHNALVTEMSASSARFGRKNECLAGCREEPLLGREGVFGS